MVIMGPKPLPEEEPEQPKGESKSQIFTIKWIKDFGQNFSSTHKINGDGVGTSFDKKKGKKKQNGWSMVKIRNKNIPSKLVHYENGYFSYNLIKAATKNFSPENKIGEGGFGSVYKGVLHDKTEIAVKHLSTKSKQGKREFLNEINTISTFRHPNLVILFGHCAVSDKLLLVYEYMENRCLGTALFGTPNKKERLNWQTRLKICIGIAKGLAYLHEGAPFKIVHRDIKLSNVLLDKDLNPKIADFGLAKIDLEEDTHISTRIAGTIGYMAPEYAMRGYLTEKADIYSFGVIILELISGRRCSYNQADDFPYLLDWAVVLQKKGDLLSLIDKDLEKNISMNEVVMVLNLAMVCVSCSPKLRPSMSEVVNVLEGKIIMKTPTIPLDSDDTTRFSLEMSMLDSLDNNPYSTSIETDVTHQGNVDSTLENEISILSSHHVASKEEAKDNTHTTFHGDLLYDKKDSKVDEGEDGDGVKVGVISSHHIALMEEDNKHTTFHGDFVSDANDSKSEERGKTIAVQSSQVASNEDDHIACHDFLPSHVKNSMGEGGNDSKSLIHVHVAKSEPSTSNAKWLTDATKVESEGELKYIEPYFEEGKYNITCSDEELEVGCNKWKNSLIGYVLNEEGPFNVDKEMVEDILREVRENVSVFSMGNGYFLLQFSCVDDKIRVLESSGLWHIEQKPLILRKWDWKLKFDEAEHMKSIPLWVKIYNLPLFLWNTSFLSKVGSVLGIPLYVDQTTMREERLDYARICIEMDASKPLLDSFLISVKGINYRLNLEYDWRPLRCIYCSTFGHIEPKCKLKMKGKKQILYSN